MKITKTHLLIGVIVVFLFWSGSAVIIHKYSGLDHRGTFGDMFGAINALFSGLALFGIIVSILIQQKELNLQRKELSDTRKEFKVNRLTNVLFNQVDYLNNSIEKKKLLYPTIFENSWEEKDFDNFSMKFLTCDNSDILEKTLEENLIVITSIITQILSATEAFVKVLDVNDLNLQERQEFKLLFKSNLNVKILSTLKAVLEHTKLYLELGKISNIEKENTYNSLSRDIKIVLSFFDL